MSPSNRQPSTESYLPVPNLPAHHLWAHSPTLKIPQSFFFFKLPLIIRIGLDGGPHVVPTFRGEVSSASAAWEGYSAPDVWLVFRRGQGPTWTQPPLRLKALSPPRLLGTAVLPAVPGLASHSTPMPAPLSTSFSLCRELKQQPQCRLMLQLSVVASSSTTWP